MLARGPPQKAVVLPTQTGPRACAWRGRCRRPSQQHRTLAPSKRDVYPLSRACVAALKPLVGVRHYQRQHAR
eukprot:2301495-Rhodomonas_salina.1